MEREDIILETFDPEHIMKIAPIPLICVYKRPADYPQKFVARLWNVDRATRYIVLADTIEEVRKAVPPDMIRFPRDQKDDPCIIESYI